jgi:erythromycin esterase-like protein
VRPALEGSWEALFHEQPAARFLLDLGAGGLRARRLQRAIGVVYRPETERHSHYLHARLRDQFDMILHIDETRALEPLERSSLWEAGELPETYPWGT